MEELGQKILASEMANPAKFASFRSFARDAAKDKNRIVAGDIVASAVKGLEIADFKGLALSETSISLLDMERCSVKGLDVGASLIQEIILPNVAPEKTQFHDCQIGKVFGITDRGAIPDWLQSSEIGEMESAANVSRIKAMHLEPQQRVLITILKKIFLQKGAGRQEAALLRGLGQIDRKGAASEIIKILKRDGLIKEVPGDHGKIYMPERKHTDRVKALIGELSTSQDSIWAEVTALKR